MSTQKQANVMSALGFGGRLLSRAKAIPGAGVLTSGLRTASRKIKPLESVAYGAAYQAVPEITNQSLRGEVSSGERAFQVLASLAAGRFMASDKLRMGLRNRLMTLKPYGPNLNREVLSLRRTAGALTLAGGANTLLPFLASHSLPARTAVSKSLDTFNDVVTRASDDAIENNTTLGAMLYDKYKQNLESWTNPEQLKSQARDLVKGVGYDFAQSGAPEYFMKYLGLTAALGIPSLVGGLTLGNAMFPENKTLAPKKQISQYKKRLLAQTVAGTALGMGGVALASKLMNNFHFEPAGAPGAKK